MSTKIKYEDVPDKIYRFETFPSIKLIVTEKKNWKNERGVSGFTVSRDLKIFTGGDLFAIEFGRNYAPISGYATYDEAYLELLNGAEKAYQESKEKLNKILELKRPIDS